MSTSNESQGTPVPQAERTVPAQKSGSEEKSESPADVAQARAEFQEKARTYLIEQARHVVVPSFARWFDMNTVHQIEKRLFPDFFPEKETGSTYKTPEVYCNMRDFMINAYRINPIEYLSVTALRRNLAGDVASVIRIHRFLEKWGLINYQIDPRTKPSLVGPQYTGHYQITLDTPKGLTPFVPEGVDSTPSSEPVAAPKVKKAPEPEVKREVDDAIPINLEVTRNIFNDVSEKKASTGVTYFCNETGLDASTVRYHNLKAKALAGGTLGPLVISKECFEQGLFPSSFVSSDFVKLERTLKQAEWTQQEVLLLLEGIEMFATAELNYQSLFVNSNGQWDRIAEHVSSKSREECLIKFLQLPIEDKYLHKLVKPQEPKSDGGLDKDSVIQDVVRTLLETKEGAEHIDRNASAALSATVLDQTNLVNQIVELTLEKVEAKLKVIGNLEADMKKTEHLLNMQRKQMLIERWLGYEKLARFKRSNTNPDLDPLLDDLLLPVNALEINKAFTKITLDAEPPEPTPEAEPVAAPPVDKTLPISVTQPKAYKFWTA